MLYFLLYPAERQKWGYKNYARHGRSIVPQSQNGGATAARMVIFTRDEL